VPKTYSHATFHQRALEWLLKEDEATRGAAPIPCACFNIRKAARAISQIYDEALQPVGLRSTQYSLLTAISYVGQDGIAALAEVLATDRTTLSRNLRPLLEHGWVESAATSDKRKRSFELTPEGRSRLNAAVPLWEAAQERIADGLGEESFERLRALANDIAALAKEED
jgi:DNA-binding MarR family transcriptional regulator